MLIALDPENKVDMHEVLGPLNLEFKAEPLANEQASRAGWNRRSATAPTW